MRRMSSTLTNPNLLGAYLLMILSVVLAIYWFYWKGLIDKSILSEEYTAIQSTDDSIALLLFVTMLLAYSWHID